MLMLFLRLHRPRLRQLDRQPTQSLSSSLLMPDPVGLGHVSSLPRPGGNITGLSGLGSDIAAKTLEIFKETVLTRFGAFWSPSAPWHRTFLQDAESASAKLGTKLYALPIRTLEDFIGSDIRAMVWCGVQH
jgi:ABC-type uncharacterized transport system substrate-binding protein